MAEHCRWPIIRNVMEVLGGHRFRERTCRSEQRTTVLPFIQSRILGRRLGMVGHRIRGVRIVKPAPPIMPVPTRSSYEAGTYFAARTTAPYPGCLYFAPPFPPEQNAVTGWSLFADNGGA